MKKNKIFCLLIFSLYMSSCKTSKNDAVGLYVSQNNINTIDTVRVLHDGTYVNSVYRKKDMSLVYKNEGKWKYNDGRIVFHDFFNDEDDVYSNEVKKFDDVLMTTELSVERKLGKIIIHHISNNEHIYLEKIN